MAAAAGFFARRAGTLAALFVCLGLVHACDRPAQEDSDSAFDFYVLALSWSPSFCAAEGDEAHRAPRAQCRADPPHKFVVHGLWPQYEEGWPEFCEPGSEEWVPDELVEEMLDIMPSAGLIGHQWRRHGSCSGLSMADYFALTRGAWERLDLEEVASLASAAVEPEMVAKTLRDANPGIEYGGMAVTCDEARLRELRVCMTRELEFRACPEVAAYGCALPSVDMPAP